MTRVLHVIAEMGVGGAESMVAGLLRAGPGVGWRSAVASAGGSLLTSAAENGPVTHYDVPLTRRRPGGVLAAARGLRRACVDFSPDVVIAHNIGATAVAALGCVTVAGRFSLLSVFHGVAAADYRSAARVLDRCPDRVITVSASLRDRLSSAGMRRLDAVVVPNAVFPPQLPTRDEARLAVGVDPEVPVALCLARIVAQKRHDVLLRAWARLPKEAVLLLAGDGDQREQHQRLAHDLGIADRARFLGMRGDVATLLAASDVSTLASDWEGLPVAVLESMSAGLPVVATAVDGLVEAVQEGEGILVPPRDPAALAEGLATYLFDDHARRTASRAAKSGVLLRHDPGRMIAAYAEVAERAAATGAPHQRLRRFAVGR